VEELYWPVYASLWDIKIRRERIGAGSKWVESELGIRKGFIFMKET